MTTKSVSERQKTFRSRKTSLGWQRKMFYLSPEAQAALAAIQSRDGATADGAMQAALLLLAAGCQVVSPKISPEISQEIRREVADPPAVLELVPLEKLQLNDASLTFEKETSTALGFGFRCGFLGLLHMEIITERLEREFDLDLVTTTPGVEYRITKTDGTVEVISNPTGYPDPSQIAKQEEPFVDVHVYTPNEYVGSLMDLCQAKRGIMLNMKYMDQTRVDLHYEMPLGEIVYDFFDAIKSRSRGYASYDYEFKEFRSSELVKLDFLLNGDIVDALSMIVFRDNAYAKGRRICEKLRDNIPRQLFEVPVQAAVGGKVIARETVKAVRKDVLAKCYGGDITRKKKLLEKQKEGKKKMRQLGTVELPSEAFTAVLKLDSTDD